MSSPRREKMVPGRNLALVASLLLATAAFAKVKVITDPHADMSRYHTYRWLPPRVLFKTGLVENDDVVAPLIRMAVSAQLTKLGMTETADSPDFEISAWAFKQSIPQVEAYLYPGVYDINIGAAPQTLGRYNHEGTLFVNLIDAKTQKSFWAAFSSGSFEKPSQLQSRVDKGAAEIFKKYPKSRKP